MTSDEAPAADAIIVGGGFSGTMVAAQLARREISSVLIEGGGRLARGIAYSTNEPAHVLNVRAEVMSAWPEDLQDFARQIEAEGGSAKDFVERGRFGRYLGEQLDNTGPMVTTIEQTAVSASRDGEGWTVTLEDGTKVGAKALVLATGNQPPAPMAVAEGIPAERFISNPWGEEAKAAVRRLAQTDGKVLILGTGLTAVDLILLLHANVHRGRITALSRRGQLPRGHIMYEPQPIERDELPMGNVLKLWRWLRKRAGQGSWRAAVDAMRPHSSAVWQSFDDEQQRRFLRHARPWWDSHRHRIATEVAERIKYLIGLGHLEIVAGRVQSMRETADGVEVEILRRGRDKAETEQFDTIFNCTGPLGEMKRTANPLLRQMLGDGLVKIDHRGIGLEVDGKERAGDRLWAMGPLTKGRYWEIIAVPDIRGQAERVAADIETELG